MSSFASRHICDLNFTYLSAAEKCKDLHCKKLHLFGLLSNSERLRQAFSLVSLHSNHSNSYLVDVKNMK